jgi:hypothetical protein
MTNDDRWRCTYSWIIHELMRYPKPNWWQSFVCVSKHSWSLAHANPLPYLQFLGVVKLLSFLSPEDPSCLLFPAPELHIYCFRLPSRHSCHCMCGRYSLLLHNCVTLWHSHKCWGSTCDLCVMSNMHMACIVAAPYSCDDPVPDVGSCIQLAELAVVTSSIITAMSCHIDECYESSAKFLNDQGVHFLCVTTRLGN